MKHIKQIWIVLFFFMLLSNIIVSATDNPVSNGTWGLEVEVTEAPVAGEPQSVSSGTWGASVNIEYFIWSSWSDWWYLIYAPGFNPPIDFVATGLNSSVINLTWNLVGNATQTYINRQKNSYPTNINEGTNIYNNTGNSFDDTNLDIGTQYFYSAWGYNDSTTQFTDDYSVTSSYTAPGDPSSFIVTSNSTTTIDFSWTKGTNASRTVIIMNTSDYPTDITEGIEKYNDTSNSAIITDLNISTVYYFSAWSYTGNMFSEGYVSISNTTRSYGSLTLWVFKETEPNIAILNYTTFIKNQDGSETYENSSCNNPHFINLSLGDLPLGEDVVVQISKDGYYTRIQYMDLFAGYDYNVTFYLPPSPEGGGDPDDPDYVPPEGEGTVLKTETRAVTDYTTDMIIYLTYRAYEIVNVYVYNNSVKVWETIPNDKYNANYSNGTVIINNTVLDENSSVARIDYYAFSDEKYARRYIILIKSETDDTLEETKVVIERYINTTGQYENIYVIYTDGYGTVGVYLIPDVLYQITLSKSGYETAIYNLLPIPIVFVEDRYHTFILTHEETVIPFTETVHTNISYSVYPSGTRHTDVFTFWFNITSSDNKLEWYRMTALYYNDTTDTWVQLSSQNETNSYGGSLNFTIPNVTGKYSFACYYKKTGFDEYEISETGSLIHFYVHAREALEGFPDFAWYLIIIIVTLVIMGICIRYYSTGISTGYIGLGVMGIMLLMKDVTLPLGGTATISGWGIWAITFLIYTIGVFLWSRI